MGRRNSDFGCWKWLCEWAHFCENFAGSAEIGFEPKHETTNQTWHHGMKKHTKMIANEDTAKWNRIDLTNISMWLYHNIQLYTWISVEFGPLRVQSTQLDIFWCWFFSQMWIPKEASETDSEMNMIFFLISTGHFGFSTFQTVLVFCFFSSQEHIIEYRVPQRSGGRGEESSRNFPTPNSISTLQKPWVFVGDFNRFGTRLTRLRDGMIRKYPYQHIPYSQPHSYHPKKTPRTISAVDSPPWHTEYHGLHDIYRNPSSISCCTSINHWFPTKNWCLRPKPPTDFGASLDRIVFLTEYSSYTNPSPMGQSSFSHSLLKVPIPIKRHFPKRCFRWETPIFSLFSKRP